MSKRSYNVHELAELSGVSSRTLHYYDEIGLLTPLRTENNYRTYGFREVERLQQILLYRRLGMQLKEIKRLLDDESFDVEQALLQHLENLQAQQRQTNQLIETINKTLSHMKGERLMEDKERFEGFKQQLIAENEEKYGEEIREKYGDEVIDDSNAQLAGMTPEQWQHSQDLDAAYKEKLQEALETGDPASPQAQEACELHKQWLTLFWPKGMYSIEAHRGLAEMYLSDERFRSYLGTEAGEFFRDALAVFKG